MFVGNLFVFFKFRGLEHIDLSTRNLVFWVLSGIGGVGLIVFALLPKIRRDEDIDSPHEIHVGPVEALKNAFKLFLTRKMIFISLTSCYTGEYVTTLFILT